MLARLERAGVELVSITQRFNDDSLEKIMPIMLALFDEYLAVDAGSRIRRAMRANAERTFHNGVV
ncbi:hypothetical protein [Sphingomonas sp. M1-B02]|uniref:hypothetical protein n=1 Tax=Sphingomonas sp. M1-B02 TaxID=3114300 RepID=UPI00223EFDBF|nr:hypothetical protein [Sphingomonas sp. S6-11]UZK66287.1 hypothetical protein OKW87_00140 [Sphingomonas sp. S6-11]